MKDEKRGRRQPLWAQRQGRSFHPVLPIIVVLDVFLLAACTFSVWYGVQLEDGPPLVIGVLGLAMGLAVLLWIVPHIQVPAAQPLEYKERIELRDKSRATLAQILGGSLLLVGIFTASENLRSTKEAEFTDRLIRCVQLLGSENKEGKKQMDSRVGAIYALAEVASQSDKQSRIVMEILAAYVKSHAQEQDGVKTINPHSSQVDWVDSDIQAALNVLVKRDTKYDPPNGWLDLSGARLVGADFTAGADISSIIQGGAGHLGRMRLVGCDLEHAFLSSVDMSQAVLHHSSLKGAFLNRTLLDKADISYADLTYASLKGASLRQANLSSANLSATDLSGADLTDAKVSQGQLNSAIGDSSTKLPRGLVFPTGWFSH